MPERDGYIPGVPCWVDVSQPDPEAAVAFYGGLFGWEFEDAMPPDAESRYFMARLRGKAVAAVGSSPPGAPPMAVWNTYVSVENADATAAKARDAGGTVMMEPFDVMDAGRMAVIADPEGAVFCVWQAGRNPGAELVNEHGTVNFNGLNTRDIETAKAFYGSVFGWRTLPMGGGVEMWTVPGYGDHLAERDPGLRERVAEIGGATGFEDVVASINPLSDEQADIPAHWSVTFAVDDADGVAARAAELGGSVVLAPMDAPWVRMTVIADPQGGTFIANQFVPENRELVEAQAAGPPA
jgi:predicted enzyme related to lactoylglutathione lyase